MTGTMEIHGVRRTIQVPATVTVATGRIEVRDRTALQMSDYGIQPPQAFFFIRVQDQVQVHFTLVAEPVG